jgi:hypothetical protein
LERELHGSSVVAARTKQLYRRMLMTLPIKIRNIVPGLAFAALALTAGSAFADEAKVPTTAAEHEALTKQYKEQAAQYKKVADEHRAMAAAYAKAHPDAKGGAKNPWNQKMQKHCEALAKDADKLAADSEKAADFQTQLAKEEQRK